MSVEIDWIVGLIDSKPTKLLCVAQLVELPSQTTDLLDTGSARNDCFQYKVPVQGKKLNFRFGSESPFNGS